MKIPTWAYYNLTSITTFFILAFFSLSSIAAEKDLIGKWYDQNNPNSTLELFEDNDAMIQDKTTSPGSWTQLKDGRVKVKVKTFFGDMILLGNINGGLLTLSFDNKTLYYKKTAPKVISKKEIYSKTTRIKPNPTKTQRYDPNYLWSSPDKDGLKNMTAMHVAARDADLEAIKALIKKGSNVNSKATRKTVDLLYSLTPLDFAYGAIEISKPYTETNRNKSIIKLLESNGALMGTAKVTMSMPEKFVNSKDYLKEELFEAFIKRDPEKVHQLIKQGADAESAGICDSKSRGITSTHDMKVYMLMLGAGADVNCKDANGFGPLDDTNQFEIARILLIMGSNPNQKTSSGSPLHNALQFGIHKLARLYISYGADINAIGGLVMDKKGGPKMGTPLSVLESRNWPNDKNLIKLLKMSGAKKEVVPFPNIKTKLPKKETKNNSQVLNNNNQKSEAKNSNNQKPFSLVTSEKACTPIVDNNGKLSVQIFDGKKNTIYSNKHKTTKKKRYDGFVWADSSTLTKLETSSNDGMINLSEKKIHLKAAGSYVKASQKDGSPIAKLGGCPVSEISLLKTFKKKKPFVHTGLLK